MNNNIVYYTNETGLKIKYKNLFKITFNHVIDYLKLKDKYSISLSIVNSSKIQELNKKYRNIDKPTDVLSFTYDGDDVSNDLGSIVICDEKALLQSKEFNHPLERELAFLFIHGILHSLGYDHEKKDEEEKMFKLQNDILNYLPIDFYTNLSRMKKELLIAKSKSMPTYSHFGVGAVVVTKDKKYHIGFNIENASYPATVCAERVALFSTYTKGYTKDDIVSLGCITDSKEVGTCCGVCRQVMSELMHLHCPVYIYNFDESKHLFTTVGGLLPYSFSQENLE